MTASNCKTDSDSMKAEYILEVVYSPRSDLLEPGRFIRGMLRDLVRAGPLAWRLFVRDVSAQYRQSLLGYFWAFAPPLATTATFVFLRSQKLFITAETPIPYPAYVMMGMLLWQVFVDAMQFPLKAVTAAKPILAKVQFPPEAILMSALGEVLFSFTIRLLLLVGVFLFYGLTPPVTAWLLPIAIAALVLLGFTFGLLITPLGILYTDVGQAVSVVTTFWLFLTPVIYPPQETGWAGLLSRCNPVSTLLVAGRDWLTLGSTHRLPEVVFVFLSSLLLLLAGWVCYRVAMPHLVARIGN